MNKFFCSLNKMIICAILSLTSILCIAADDLKPQEFVDEASEANMAEIQSANLAIERSLSPEIKTFARVMISDHTSTNDELKAIANRKKLKVAAETSTSNATKSKVLEVRDGESFDEAFANNQVSVHENAVKFFRSASTSVKDSELKDFAAKTLPTLERHLKMAKELAIKFKQ